MAGPAKDINNVMEIRRTRVCIHVCMTQPQTVIDHNNTLTLVLFKMGLTDCCYYGEMVPGFSGAGLNSFEVTHTGTERRDG